MVVPEGSQPELYRFATHSGSKQMAGRNNWKASVAEAGANRHTLPSDGAAAAQHGGASLGLHARAEPVRLHAVAAIGLKCALGHENTLLFPVKNLRLDGNT
jgi:hypothetical protein